MSEKSKTFEKSISRLEEIASQMEQGNVPLEQSLKLFTEGTELIRTCTELLDKAELEIVRLTKESGGTVLEKEFERKDEL